MNGLFSFSVTIQDSFFNTSWFCFKKKSQIFQNNSAREDFLFWKKKNNLCNPQPSVQYVQLRFFPTSFEKSEQMSIKAAKTNTMHAQQSLLHWATQLALKYPADGFQPCTSICCFRQKNVNRTIYLGTLRNFTRSIITCRKLSFLRLKTLRFV